MVKVKICGITNLGDAVKAREFGADLIGFIFVPGTPRYIEPDKAMEISSELGEGIGRVGLFVNSCADDVILTAKKCNLSYIQLHGEEPASYCTEVKDGLKRLDMENCKIIKAIKVGENFSSNILNEYKDCDFFLFDTFSESLLGGTGKKFDWGILNRIKQDIKKPFFVAGGLKASNVTEMVREVSPYGVDVSSGIEESVGKKDINLLKEFIDNAKKT